MTQSALRVMGSPLFDISGACEDLTIGTLSEALNVCSCSIVTILGVASIN